MKNLIIFLMLLTMTTSVIASNSAADKACMDYVVFRESSGEGILTQRAVMDVVLNRSRILGKSVCQVVHQEGQFPYMVDGIRSVPKHFLTRVEFVSKMPRVLPEDAWYFNHTKLSYGTFHVKLGNLFFNTRGVKYAVNF